MKELSKLFLKFAAKVVVIPIACVVGWLALGGIYGLMQSFFSPEVVEFIRQGSIKAIPIILTIYALYMLYSLSKFIKVLHFLSKLRDKFKDRV